MKKLLFLITLMLSPMLASAQTVSDVQNSGCTARARGTEGKELVPTIVLTKEDSILSVEVLNYKANCCTHDFYVTSNISGGNDGEPCSVSISVGPNGEYVCECECPFNVSFIIRDLEPNSFYLKCWWYEGMVKLTEGKPLVLEALTDEDDYRPMIEDGKVWKVGTISGNPVQIVDYYYFDGDTIVNGKTCRQMWCQRYVSPDYPNEYWAPKTSLSKVGAWYEEDKKVYVCREGTQGMQMLYDFSLEANDTLILNDYQPDYIVGPKQTGGLNGFKGAYRDIMLCGQEIYITTWLEGVGGIDGPLRNAYPETADPMPEFLMSCTVGDEVIYLNDEYEDGATPAGARKNRFDFTHTTKSKPKVPRRTGEELSLYGEYNDQQLGIHLDPLDDAYQVSIANESGQVAYERNINAGTIVGLSIDISAYPKGRYTVTIENSSESFTGRFDAQTTGIIDATHLNNNEQIIKNKLIYNLQGQRLSSLQKGLNIVNGRKVCIK